LSRTKHQFDLLSRNQIKINTENKARICWRLCIVYTRPPAISYTLYRVERERVQQSSAGGSIKISFIR
jgi:ABC-type phosphate/phosphonate transport system permease subunit